MSADLVEAVEPAEPTWFYHFAYQYQSALAQAYGDTTITTPWPIDNDEKLREVRAALKKRAVTHGPRPSDDVVITSITLLAAPSGTGS